MAGQLTIDTLKASSGVLATQNGMTGIAKAWINWNGSTQAINGSFNVSSITRNAAGDYTINFSTAMPNANYSAVGSANSNGALGGWYVFTPFSFSTGSVQVATTASSTGVDCIYSNAAIFSA